MAHLIEVDDAEVGYRSILTRIMNLGDTVSPRGLATKALRNVTVVWTDPGDAHVGSVRPKLSRGLMALEPLQLVGGFSDPKLTIDTVPHYANFMDDGEFHGAYGLRIRDKVGLVAERLRVDPHTRQARMNIWEDRFDLAIEGKKDYPCTTAAEFEIIDGRLCGTTYMRSNDAWLGFPYDIVQHTCLLKSLATFLGVPVGAYTHVVRNFHIYETDYDKVVAALDTELWQAPRERLDGGIGTGQELSWSDVQTRARSLTYDPCSVDPATSEEFFYHRIMIDKVGV